MKFFSRFIIISTLLTLISIHIAEGDLVSDKLTQLLQGIQSSRANFIQTITDGKGQMLQQIRGKMTLQRPGRFRWEVIWPNKQLLIADGEHIWFYDKDLRQVTVQKQQIVGTDSPAALLSNSPQNLTKYFNIAPLKNTQGFYLTPKDSNALFSSISLIFQQNQLHEMRLLDKLGQNTVITFSQIELNIHLAPQTFHFTLPNDKSIEVVKG